MKSERMISVMTKVLDWQLQHLLEDQKDHHPAGWIYAALYAGMIAFMKVTHKEIYYDFLKQIGQNNNWQLRKRIYMADDHAIGQMYIDLYLKYKDPDMIKPTKECFDYILNNRPESSLEMGSTNYLDRYSWCDALFMAPPVWAGMFRITGEEKYIDYMNEQWWITTDYLYDRQEHLFFRDSRFFTKREANGHKVFWSRGNGWVFAGIARVLEEMPRNYPDRAKYEQLFREMAAKIVSVQPQSGLWHSSLLDPDSYSSVETSGSSLYCYGLARGINRGYLEKEPYQDAVIRAWNGLVRCVHPEGMLGYVQPIGGSPQYVRSDETEIYGIGAFLLAGSEVYKIAVDDN